jgi:nicotinamide phosphoribosyltransferase
MFTNLAATLIDFYKSGHHNQYPNGTEAVYSNFTPRSNAYMRKLLPESYDGKAVVAGHQRFIIAVLVELWNETFFNVPKDAAIAPIKRMFSAALACDYNTEHLEALHDLGYLPLCIRALPEGTRCPMKVPMLTVINTDRRFGWLTNYIESVLSAEIWKKVNNATIAAWYADMFLAFAKETGASQDFIRWQGHDFSFRGMSGYADAASTGLAHLYSFYGTDTVPALFEAEYFYGANADHEIIGGSVAATEHSCTTLGIFVKKEEHNCDLAKAELEYIRELITVKYPTGIISIVADSFDFFNVVTTIAKELKSEIEARDGKVVFRPDSGLPISILCGNQEIVKLEDTNDIEADCEAWLTEYVRENSDHGEMSYCNLDGYFSVGDKVYFAEISIEWNRHDKQYYYMDGVKLCKFKEVSLEDFTPEMKGALRCLDVTFGSTVNAAGYKELNPKVGLIYGDSITPTSAFDILTRMKNMGFASSNIVFGLGSYVYQMSTRDTLGGAFKSTWGIVNNKDYNIRKDPKTDSGVKKSAEGLMIVLENDDGEIYMLDNQPTDGGGLLEKVFEDGNLLNQTTLAEIRTRLHPEWNQITF